MAIAKNQKDYKVQIINGLAERIYTVIVHRFKIGDVEDPVLYAAQPLYDFEKSERYRTANLA